MITVSVVSSPTIGRFHLFRMRIFSPPKTDGIPGHHWDYSHSQIEHIA